MCGLWSAVILLIVNVLSSSLPTRHAHVLAKAGEGSNRSHGTCGRQDLGLSHILLPCHLPQCSLPSHSRMDDCSGPLGPSGSHETCLLPHTPMAVLFRACRAGRAYSEVWELAPKLGTLERKKLQDPVSGIYDGLVGCYLP